MVSSTNRLGARLHWILYYPTPSGISIVPIGTPPEMYLFEQNDDTVYAGGVVDTHVHMTFATLHFAVLD